MIETDNVVELKVVGRHSLSISIPSTSIWK